MNEVEALRHRDGEARSIQARMMRHVVDGTTDWAEAPGTVPVEAYVGGEWLAAERRHLFSDLPLLAAMSSDLAHPGDRMVFDEVGPPILIARGDDGEVRAFMNVCPHRAARLVDSCDRGKRITCPFHGWTFDLSGRLVGQPRRDAFHGLDAAGFDLTPLPVAEWGGLVFVRPRPGGGPIDVAAHLGDLAPDLAALQLGSAQFVKRTRLDANANWKYVLDTFGEGYHVQVLHPRTVGRFVVADTVTYDAFGAHHRMSFANKAMLDTAAQGPDKWPVPELRVIYLLFPNTLIQSTPLAGGRNHIVYRIFPGDVPGSSTTLLESYRTAGPKDDVTPWIEAHDCQVEVVGAEDYPMAETAQRSMERAPQGWRLRLGRNEQALQRFHAHIARAIGRPGQP